MELTRAFADALCKFLAPVGEVELAMYQCVEKSQISMGWVGRTVSASADCEFSIDDRQMGQLSDPSELGLLQRMNSEFR